MTNILKQFVEKNIELIDDNNWRQLFINAYDEALMTSEVRGLHNMLLTSGIVDSTDIRNDLLFEYLKKTLDSVKSRYRDNPNNIGVIDTYAAELLRHYLNNTFGFYESEALQFIWKNQRALGVTLEKASRAPGQGSISNYMIHYNL